MATKKSINPVEVEQAGIIFSTIAEQVDAARQICMEAINMIGDKEQHPEILIVAVRELCGQIGLLADIGAISMGNRILSQNDGDPAKWLLPPIYHLAAEKQEAIHG
jgi:hypothetical protein